MKNELSAGNYLKDKGLRLDYSSDVFLHTHIPNQNRTRIKLQRGGGANGGGTSSRSQGGF
ncbi:MAG: hypothetical protein LBU32_20955 [Clostridiales bacterium]|nr:hypothetical protein [Clostridiales bacterium]